MFIWNVAIEYDDFQSAASMKLVVYKKEKVGIITSKMPLKIRFFLIF